MKEKDTHGVCPNCWGQQEYGQVLKDLEKDTQVDVNNRTIKRSFIQRFVIQNITGAKLKERKLFGWRVFKGQLESVD